MPPTSVSPASGWQVDNMPPYRQGRNSNLSKFVICNDRDIFNFATGTISHTMKHRCPLGNLVTVAIEIEKATEV